MPIPRAETGAAADGTGRTLRGAVRGAAERLALLALSLLLALGAVEGLLALVFPDLGRPVPTVVRRLDATDPNYAFFARQVLLRTDEIAYLHDPAGSMYAPGGIAGYGIRGKATPLRRVGDEYRILFLGDSVTAGYDCDVAYERRLRQILNATGRRPVVTLNAGHGGYSFVQERAWFEAFGAKVEPDLVILGAVCDDLCPPEAWRRVGDAFELRSVGSAPVPLLVDFGAWNGRLLGGTRCLPLAFRALGPLLARWGLAADLPLYDPDADRGLDRLRDIHRRAAALGVPFAIVQFPVGVPWDTYASHADSRFHALLARFCHTEGIPYLDLFGAFSKRDWRSLFVEWEVRDRPFAVHPNDAGHRLAASEIAQFLVREGLVPKRDLDPASTTPVTEPAELRDQ